MDKFNLKGKSTEIKAALPGIMTGLGNTAKNFFLEGFRKGGFTDQSFEVWKPRKVKLGTKAAAYSSGRGMLVKSGDLRRSIKLRSLSLFKVSISSDLVYAPVHNSGLKSGRGTGFIMPERKFVGDSVTLRKKLKSQFVSKINVILKP